MRIDIVSLFPEFVDQCAGFGVTGRARERGLLSLHGWNPRDYAEGNYRKVDDRTFGGGPGMVMKVEPFARQLELLMPDWRLAPGVNPGGPRRRGRTTTPGARDPAPAAPGAHVRAAASPGP